MEFDGEVNFGRTGDRQVGNPRFPSTWPMGLAKEGSKRKLGRWVSFERSGFGIYGEELTDSANERELLKLRSWWMEEEEGEQGKERTRARAGETMGTS